MANCTLFPAKSTSAITLSQELLLCFPVPFSHPPARSFRILDLGLKHAPLNAHNNLMPTADRSILRPNYWVYCGMDPSHTSRSGIQFDISLITECFSTMAERCKQPTCCHTPVRRTPYSPYTVVPTYQRPCKIRRISRCQASLFGVVRCGMCAWSPWIPLSVSGYVFGRHSASQPK